MATNNIRVFVSFADLFTFGLSQKKMRKKIQQESARGTLHYKEVKRWYGTWFVIRGATKSVEVIKSWYYDITYDE